MPTSPVHGNAARRGIVSAVVLAAGASRRFGGYKLLAPLGSQPIIRHSVDRLRSSEVDEIVVVLGREAERVRAALKGMPVRFVVNERYSDGLGSSLALGVQALDPRTALAVIALGDQPTIDPTVVDHVLEVAREGTHRITVPAYRGVRGHPIVFASAILPELLAIRGDVGAREIIARNPTEVHEVAIDAAAPRDVDTAADLEEIAREFEGR